MEAQMSEIRTKVYGKAFFSPFPLIAPLCSLLPPLPIFSDLLSSFLPCSFLFNIFLATHRAPRTSSFQYPNFSFSSPHSSTLQTSS